MKKFSHLLSALVFGTLPVHAALIIEPEPEPAYTPYAPVAPATTAIPYTPPATSQPVPPPATPSATAAPIASPTPAVAAPESSRESFKALLAQDASKAMNQPSAAAQEQPKMDPRLAGLSNENISSLSAEFSLNPKKTEVATVTVTETVEEKAEVVNAVPVTRPTPWKIEAGTLLRDALNQWGDQAGWKVIWNMPEQEDFRIESGNKFAGDFKEAVHSLFGALPQHIQIFAKLVPDNVPPLLYVTPEPGVQQ